MASVKRGKITDWTNEVGGYKKINNDVRHGGRHSGTWLFDVSYCLFRQIVIAFQTHLMFRQHEC